MKELDVYRSLWRETKVKSMKPRDIPRDIPIYSRLTESTDKSVKAYFMLLAEVGGM